MVGEEIIHFFWDCVTRKLVMGKSFSGLVGRSGDDKVSDMGRKECLVFSHCLGAEVVGWEKNC